MDVLSFAIGTIVGVLSIITAMWIANVTLVHKEK
jgi:hypothetical protein